MANVFFKRGSQTNLNSLTSSQIVDGSFYLTTDSNRLYVGQKVNQTNVLKLLNQTIQIVDNIKALPAISSTFVNDVYYIKTGNILAINRGDGEWTQINPDTTISDVATTVGTADSDGVVAVETKYQTSTAKRDSDSGDPEPTAPLTSAFDVKGSSGVSVNSFNEGKGLEIKGTTYTHKTSVSGDIATITLEGAGASTGTSDVKLIAGDNVGFVAGTDNNHEIRINASYVDTVVSGGTLTLEDGKIGGSITISDGTNSTSIGLTPSAAISYTVGTQGYKPGSTLPVYTKSEIDEIVNGLDGLKYKGTAGVSNPLPTTNVESGWMYMVADEELGVGNITAKRGDLLIATGTEVNGVITGDVVWTHVPSGDDTSDTTYYFIGDADNNTFKFQASTSAASVIDSQFSINGGKKIVVEAANNDTTTDKHNAEMTFTVKHDGSSATAKSVTADPTSGEFSAITAIASDDTGHVTEVTTTKFSILSYDLIKKASVQTVTSNREVSVEQVLTQGGTQVGNSQFNVKSQSLTVAASTTGEGDAAVNAVSVELEWGTF